MRSQKLLQYHLHPRYHPRKFLCKLRLLLRIYFQIRPLRALLLHSLEKLEQQRLHRSFLRILHQVPSLGQVELKQQIYYLQQLQVQLKLVKVKNRKTFLNKKNKKKMKKRKSLRHRLDFLELH